MIAGLFIGNSKKMRHGMLTATLENLCRGALIERVDAELEKVVQNFPCQEDGQWYWLPPH